MKFISTYLLLIIILSLLASGCTSQTSSLIQEGELELILSPDTIHVDPGETFYLNLSLKNNGENTLNVVEMEEHFSYNIKYANGSDIAYIALPGVVPPYDETIVSLGPGESLTVTANSRYWDFSEGEHFINAIYFIEHDGDLTQPHWKGTVTSNNITLIVGRNV